MAGTLSFRVSMNLGDSPTKVNLLDFCPIRLMSYPTCPMNSEALSTR